MKSQLIHTFEDIISLENLCLAWKEFIRSKRGKLDVQEFQYHLMNNIIALQSDLANKSYRHGGYQSFRICDSKPRHIHKASVRDRLLHHAIYQILYPFFDRTFIGDSFSCRVDKGVHKALNRFRAFGYKVSRNHTKTCWVLKCDVRKFFGSIDHGVLLRILQKYIPDRDILWLLENVVQSFTTKGKPRMGLPLGNLTSQLFANVYMNELDQFVKRRLKIKHYIRYADDFVVLSEDCEWLKDQIPKISQLLQKQLHMQLHPNKVLIKTSASGIDFLGWVHFSGHRVLRTATKRRMMRRLRERPEKETLQSYLGLLSHGNTHKLKDEVLQRYWMWR